MRKLVETKQTSLILARGRDKGLIVYCKWDKCLFVLNGAGVLRDKRQSAITVFLWIYCHYPAVLLSFVGFIVSSFEGVILYGLVRDVVIIIPPFRLSNFRGPQKQRVIGPCRGERGMDVALRPLWIWKYFHTRIYYFNSLTWHCFVSCSGKICDVEEQKITRIKHPRWKVSWQHNSQLKLDIRTVTDGFCSLRYVGCIFFNESYFFSLFPCIFYRPFARIRAGWLLKNK